jgi:predicted O-linked N-acetylglucosamine transferase (SPINDLY family)
MTEVPGTDFLEQQLRALQENLPALETFVRRLAGSARPELVYLCGEWLLVHGHAALALRCLGPAAQALPSHVLAAHNHGEALRQCGRPEDAALEFQRAIGLQFDFMPSRKALVDLLERVVLQMRAADQPALAEKQAAGLAHLLNETGWLLLEAGQGVDAWNLFKRALDHSPRFAPALSNLGNVLRMEGQLGEAERCCREALQINPQLAPAWCNLGNVLADRGRRSEAEACFDRALALDPGMTIAQTNKLSGTLFNALHSNELSDAEVFDRHLQWGRAYAGTPPAHDHPAWQPGQALRVGYLSADFRSHAMRHFLEPLLAGHDRHRVQVVCYMQSRVVDEMTLRLQGYGHDWVVVEGMDDDALVQRIRADGVHILVDCLGHTQGSRLTALARKPAPVMMSYLGYLGSTGLPAMDFRVTDEWMDPPGLTEAQHTERLLRIPGGCVGYSPHLEAPEVNPLPALSAGAVTFGSLNKIEKLNLAVVRTWSGVLARVPGSRLLLKSRQLSDPMVAGRILGLFEAQGIESSRLLLQPGTRGHLSAYHEIDIALDPFPFGGGATTCDALWMGVPVITTPGTRSASRLTHCILHTIGHPEWSTQSREQYIDKAESMAQDLESLAALRARLRQDMQASALVDARGLTQRLEQAYESALGSLRTAVPAGGVRAAPARRP